MEDSNMKNILKYTVTAMVLVLVCVSCDKFLDRPAEDSYTTANY